MGRRRICDGCGRPESVCLCHALVERQTPFRVLIWQDPDESRHPLSTAPLLHRSLMGSQLMVGDQFEPEQLLGANWVERTLLLYPLDNKPAVSDQPAGFDTLLILDGTWRKVRRLLLLNPWLTELNHLALTPDSDGLYSIRKSPRDDGISTLEAGVMACHRLHPDGDYQPITQVLKAMVAIQSGFQPD